MHRLRRARARSILAPLLPPLIKEPRVACTGYAEHEPVPSAPMYPRAQLHTSTARPLSTRGLGGGGALLLQQCLPSRA